MMVLLALSTLAHAGPAHGGGAVKVDDDPEVLAALQARCEKKAKLKQGYDLGGVKVWPSARCGRLPQPMMRTPDGRVGPARGTPARSTTVQLDLDLPRHRVAASIRAVPGDGGLLYGALFPLKGDLEVVTSGPWARGPVGWFAAPDGEVHLERSVRLKRTDCHVERDRVMIAATCGVLPMWGGRWSLEVQGLADGWQHSWTAEEPLAVTVPALFALADAEVAAHDDHVRVLASPTLSMPDGQADAIAERASAAHDSLEEPFGALPDVDWTVVPVTFGGGYESTSGYPGVGAGYRDQHPSLSVQHEVAHAWFGGVTFPDLLAPGGHWHEALATWALAHDPDATEEFLWMFIQGLRDDGPPPPSLLDTSYLQTGDSNKYGRGLAAMLTFDAVVGRDRVVAATRVFLDEHHHQLTTWRDLLAVYERELGTDDTAYLRSWLHEPWTPTLTQVGDAVVLDDPVHPHHQVRGQIFWGAADSDLLGTCDVSFGQGEVPTCEPPTDWAFAIVQPQLPVSGTGVVLRRSSP